MTAIEFTMAPFRTTTGLNVREHFMARKRRVDRERARTATELWLAAGPRGVLPGDPSRFRERVGPGPYVVTLTRISPRLADDDNAIGALKSIRDEIAKWLGTGDGPDAPVTWKYLQDRGLAGVRVRIEGREEA